MEHLPPRKELDAAYVSEIVGQPVKSYTVAEGSNKGDNVIGKMLALKVETEEGELSDIVIKSILPLVGEVDAEAIGQSQFYVALQVFPAEIAYYEMARPLLQQVTDYSMISPKLFSAVTDGLNDYIALEDLRPLGFKMADKKKGLTVQEVTLVLKKVAELHAKSYVLLTQGNPTMQRLLDSILNDHVWQRKIIDLDQAQFYNHLIQKMVEVMRETGDAQTADKMERFVQIGHKTMIDLWEKRGSTPKYFQTLLHGDLWTNNIMFKYATDGETVEDVAFVDFQQCRFGTIYEDLLYFIFTSTTAEFRKNHLRTCLQSYFKEFQGILESLGTNLPAGLNDEELIATFYENIEYGFCYNLVAIPFQLGAEQGPPQDNIGAAPQNEEQQPQLSATAMAMIMAEVMKQGTKSSPIGVLRLQELCAEMIKLNILF